MNLANEGLEARKKEEEVNARKRKAEDDASWEGALFISCVYKRISRYTANREQRVGSWRDFAKSTTKKKKKKVEVLG